jgi:hypothetical protein
MPDKEDYPETPAGYAARWTKEFAAAKEHVRPWWERGDKIVARFVDDRKADRSTAGDTRLNLFTANTQTLRSLLYGKTPQVDVARRFADSEDDVARVAAEMQERILNTDLEKDSDTAAEAFRQALDDRLLPGMGNVKVGYDPGEPQVEPAQPAQIDPMTGQELAPEVPSTSITCTGRTNSGVRAGHSITPLVGLRQRNVGGGLRCPLRQRQAEGVSGQEESGDKGRRRRRRPSTRTIWPAATCGKSGARSARRSIGSSRAIRRRSTTKTIRLGLENFWPFPRPMVANLTTSKFLPVPDFVLAQDLYEGIDTLESGSICWRTRSGSRASTT